jgi:hypothetical protein
MLPGGRGHRQITQNMPYKNKFCGGKLEGREQAVEGPILLKTGREKVYMETFVFKF